MAGDHEKDLENFSKIGFRYLMVIVRLALNPVPLTVTVVPEDPLVGVMVILCPTVKVAVA